MALKTKAEVHQTKQRGSSPQVYVQHMVCNASPEQQGGRFAILCTQNSAGHNCVAAAAVACLPVNAVLPRLAASVVFGQVLATL